MRLPIPSAFSPSQATVAPDASQVVAVGIKGAPGGADDAALVLLDSLVNYEGKFL